MEQITDICCIGHITLDKIITPERVTYLNGGTSYYFSHALSNLPPIKYKLITALAKSEMGAADELRRAGIDVTAIESKHTVYFENKYEANMNHRTQRVLAKADAFTLDMLKDAQARYIHFGSLLADDFSLDVIKGLNGRGLISVDAQGFLRYVDGEKVYPCDWANKLEAFKYIDILKVNEFEVESLTGHKDLKEAAFQLIDWGIKEVCLTLGSYGSVICDGKTAYEVPAFTPKAVVDATGCGDTYSAGYLYVRSQGGSCTEAGKFAAAMSSLKLEHSGPFNGSIHDIEAVIYNKRK